MLSPTITNHSRPVERATTPVQPRKTGPICAFPIHPAKRENQGVPPLSAAILFSLSTPISTGPRT